jgi:hypothetical protein
MFEPMAQSPLMAILEFLDELGGDQEPDEFAQDLSFRPHLATTTLGEGMRQGRHRRHLRQPGVARRLDFDVGDVRCPTWL